MGKDVLISVIIPVYNVEKYLCRCVDSVINQTYKNLEIILVDDGSTDNSPQICDEYAKKDNRIKVIHKTNSGPAETRNAGLNIAKGKYIGFIDSDDYLPLDRFETMINIIEQTKTDLLVCDYESVGYKGDTVVSKKEKHNFFGNRVFVDKDEIFNEIIKSYVYYGPKAFCMAPPWNKLFLTEFLNKNDLRFPSGFVNEDWYFNLFALAKKPSITFSDKIVYSYFTDFSRDTMSRHVNVGYKYLKCKDDFYRENLPELDLDGKEYLTEYHNNCINCQVRIIQSDLSKSEKNKLLQEVVDDERYLQSVKTVDSSIKKDKREIRKRIFKGKVVGIIRKILCR